MFPRRREYFPSLLFLVFLGLCLLDQLVRQDMVKGKGILVDRHFPLCFPYKGIQGVDFP
jgi:hypothetical protein